MGLTTIAWTDYSFNGWRGCSRVSPGCEKCYAEALSHRNPEMFGEWGPGKLRVLASDAMWRQPEKWNREAQRDVTRQHNPRVFCGSLCDWLDPDVPIEWLARLLDLIRRTPNLDWLMLSKRPENFDRRILHAQLWLIDHCKRAAPQPRAYDMAATAAWLAYWRPGEQVPTNVWMGVSAENQEYWDKRVPVLLSIPAKVRFVSCEPLLGAISLRHDEEWMFPGGSKCRINQVIFGGESGPHFRPCDPEWIKDGVRQCREAGVAAFVKQDSGRLPGRQGRIDDETWKVKEFPV